MGVKMHISNHGIETLKQIEGMVIRNRKHVIYDDKTGEPVPRCAPLPNGATIGYGHLIKSGESFTHGITEDAATEILRADVARAENTVCKTITVPLAQNQFDALVIFAFTIGEKNFARSTVVKYINNPDFISTQYPTLDAAWRAWNKSGGRVVRGLARRREMELKLFHGI
jgi:type VI secretion system secreted protein VgrG